MNRRDRRIALTVALYLSAVLPAALFENMGNVLAFTGAIGGSCLSYIGPGLVYIGVHGGRFMELLDNSWLSSMIPINKKPPSSSSKTRQQSQTTKEASDIKKVVTHAVETTPLVNSEAAASEVAQKLSMAGNDGGGTELSEDSFIVYCVKFAVWHLTLCPIWVALASGGKAGLTRHVHDLALKSPHPIRIGDVEYSRALVNQLGRVDADPEHAAVVWPAALGALVTPPQDRNPPVRSGSDNDLPIMPLLAANPLASISSDRLIAVAGDSQLVQSPGSTANQRIGQAILQKQKQARKQQKQQSAVVEPDPQEAPPSWYDFVVAIFFILFGCLAMVAGILSLFVSNEDSVGRRRRLLDDQVP